MVKRLALGVSLSPSTQGTGGGIKPPAGYVLLTDPDGALLTDPDGTYYLEVE